MRAVQIDERDISAEAQAVFVVYLYERIGPPAVAEVESRSTDVYAIHDATFTEVMSWVAERVQDADMQWALGIIAPGGAELLWVHGGDPHIREETRTDIEARQMAEMDRIGNRVFRIGGLTEGKL